MKQTVNSLWNKGISVRKGVYEIPREENSVTAGVFVCVILDVNVLYFESFFVDIVNKARIVYIHGGDGSGSMDIVTEEFVKCFTYYYLTLSQMTNFRLFQTERLCNFKFDKNGGDFHEMVENSGKRRNCSLGAIYPFPTVFSKDLYCKHVKTRAWFGKVNGITLYNTILWRHCGKRTNDDIQHF